MSTTTAIPTANQDDSGLMYSPRRPVAASPSVTTASTAASPTPSHRVPMRRASRKEVHPRPDREGRQDHHDHDAGERPRREGRAHEGEHFDVHERTDEQKSDDRARGEGGGEREREER